MKINNSKKIGILTLSASDNCGSLLQCYALKHILKPFGEVEIINFSSEKSHALYDIFPKGITPEKKEKKKKFLEDLEKEKEGYATFRKEYLKINEREMYSQDLKDISNKYDYVVIGSDQVWNIKMFDFDYAFFGGWTNTHKIAYAASLGGTDLKEAKEVEQIKRWIKDIKCISVREKTGKESLENILGKEVEKVLDPTLMIDEFTWESLIGEPFVKSDYIFYYSWAYREESTSRIVAEDAKRLNLPVYVIDARKWQNDHKEKWGFILCEKSGPLAFLNLLYYSKKCYVESFHGMIFAYIFKKNFWILDIYENYENLDARMKEFVELLGIQNRIVTKYNVEKINQDDEMIFCKNRKLDDMKKISRDFLVRAFEER